MTSSKRRVVPMSAWRTFAMGLVLITLLIVPLATSAQPPSWVPPEVVVVPDKTHIQPGETVRFTITTTNPSAASSGSSTQQAGPTWYNLRLTAVVESGLRIDAASSTMGTVSVSGQTVVVNGGITLAPQEFFVTIIDCTALDLGPTGVTISLTYTDEQGVPQDPIEVDKPDVVIVQQPSPPVIPEASTLILMASAATGLTSYVGLQIRARRRRENRH